MRGLTLEQFVLAVDDLWDGITYVRLWNLLAWADIKQRYRRSTLGPLWITISMAIQMTLMATIFTYLFNISLKTMLPYIASGVVSWGFIQTVVTEGATTFVGASAILMQVRRPFNLYLAQTVWRNLIIFAHNLMILVLIAIIFRVKPQPVGILLWPLGVLLCSLCVAWMALVCAVISARFRDFPMIVQSLFAALFWITPIMYFPKMFGDKQYILDLNPFTHLLALMRDPLIGQTPSLRNWLVVLAITTAGWMVTILFFARFRARIVYWL